MSLKLGILSPATLHCLDPCTLKEPLSWPLSCDRARSTGCGVTEHRLPLPARGTATSVVKQAAAGSHPGEPRGWGSAGTGGAQLGPERWTWVVRTVAVASQGTGSVSSDRSDLWTGVGTRGESQTSLEGKRSRARGQAAQGSELSGARCLTPGHPGRGPWDTGSPFREAGPRSPERARLAGRPAFLAAASRHHRPWTQRAWGRHLHQWCDFLIHPRSRSRE